MEIDVWLCCSLCGKEGHSVRVELTEEGHVNIEQVRERARSVLGWSVNRWQDDGTTKFQCTSCKSLE